MIDPFLVESAVANWLSSAAKDLVVAKRSDRWPDFELRGKSGERILLEVKAGSLSENTIKDLARRFGSVADEGARFLLVTLKEPERKQLDKFVKAFANVPGKAEWKTLGDLPSFLNLPSPGSWTAPQTWADLQTKATISGIERYATAPLGPGPYVFVSELDALARQFSYETLARLEPSGMTLEAQLGLGSQCNNVTIVLSDIKNFSSMVKASRPDELKEAMGNYYRHAREMVFAHGGMLDKFIGDAVLAVFGYPHPKSSAACDAIRFARALTAIGDDILSSWKARLNEVIDTGTRIGVATGDIWPINIGTSGVEVTLLGDTINLAARLEKNCEVNKLLIDNRTRTAAMETDSAFVETLNLAKKPIEPADAKGQPLPILAWEMT